jgi:hypothetical protein
VATFGKKLHTMPSITIAKLFEEHVYVFFCNALYIHRNGPFQNGAKQRALVFYCSVHLHLFETALNGSFFWAFDKKRHTHAPPQDIRPSFWRLAKHFMNPKMGIMSKQKDFLREYKF